MGLVRVWVYAHECRIPQKLPASHLLRAGGTSHCKLSTWAFGTELWSSARSYVVSGYPNSGPPWQAPC